MIIQRKRTILSTVKPSPMKQSNIALAVSKGLDNFWTFLLTPLAPTPKMASSTVWLFFGLLYQSIAAGEVIPASLDRSFAGLVSQQKVQTFVFPRLSSNLSDEMVVGLAIETAATDGDGNLMAEVNGPAGRYERWSTPTAKTVRHTVCVADQEDPSEWTLSLSAKDGVGHVAFELSFSLVHDFALVVGRASEEVAVASLPILTPLSEDLLWLYLLDNWWLNPHAAVNVIVTSDEEEVDEASSCARVSLYAGGFCDSEEKRLIWRQGVTSLANFHVNREEVTQMAVHFQMLQNCFDEDEVSPDKVVDKSFNLKASIVDYSADVHILFVGSVAFLLLSVLSALAILFSARRAASSDEGVPSEVAVAVGKLLDEVESSMSQAPPSGISTTVSFAFSFSDAESSAEENLRAEREELFDRAKPHQDGGGSNYDLQLRPQDRYLSSLPSKSYSGDFKRSGLYAWLTAAVGAFYFVPSVQLAMSKVEQARSDGDGDICRVNVLCATPYNVLPDLGVVVSNVSYFGFAVVFAAFVRRHQLKRRRLLLYLEEEASMRGLPYTPRIGTPQLYGPYYAMALALAWQGFLSACYHVCPTNVSYQFDTTFMQVLAALCFVKARQFRHGAEPVSTDCRGCGGGAYRVFVGLGILLVIEAIGIAVGGGPGLWAVLVPLYMVIVFFLASTLYLSEAPALPTASLARSFGPSAWLKELKRTHLQSKAVSLKRWSLAATVVVVNASFVSGAAMAGLEVPAFLVAAGIINHLTYMVYYVIMKLRCGEPFSSACVALVAAGAFCWSAAFALFSRHGYETVVSAAASRAMAHQCLMPGYLPLDDHSGWHALSAMGMTFCFGIMLTLDDGVRLTAASDLRLF
jgi:hypothetical protein